VRVVHLQEDRLAQTQFLTYTHPQGAGEDILNQRVKDWREDQEVEVAHQMAAQAALETHQTLPHPRETTAADVLAILRLALEAGAQEALEQMFPAFKSVGQAVRVQVAVSPAHR
jgi:hypothetical protein